MAATRNTLETMMLEKTAKKMKMFSINEIQKLFKILHLGLKWNDIVKQVSMCRLRLTIPNIVSVIHQYLKTSSDTIEETYHTVLLVDAIYHQTKLWWTVSVDGVKKRLLEQKIIQNNIQAMLDKLNINAATYVIECNKLFWVMINERKNKSNTNPKLNIPLFFTIAPGKELHVFHRPQKVNPEFLNIVVKSIGAKKYKPYELSGKHLQSMVNSLKNKNKENDQNIAQELPNIYKEADVQICVNRLFGNRQQVLDKLTINVESDYPISNNTDPSEQTCKTKFELSGTNVVDGVKDMMLSGVIQPPYPSWVIQLPVLSKNSIDIKHSNAPQR